MTLLLAIAATLSLCLGSIGLYGVLSHAVAGRTREIGVRVALGADPRRVRALVLREAVVLLVVGLATGGVVSVLAGRLLGSLLYEVAPGDPVALAASALLLSTVALAATLVPTRRALRLDPTRALAAD